MSIRRYYDYTRDELYALTEEQVQGLIDIEVAFHGIIPCLPPTKPPDNEPLVERTVEAYEVRNVYYATQEAALAAAAIPGYRSSYFTQVGYDHVYLVPSEATVNIVKFYDQRLLLEKVTKLQEQKRLLAAYAQATKEYKEYADNIVEIAAAVNLAVDDARSYFTRRDRVVREFEKLFAITQDKEATLRLVTHTYTTTNSDKEEFFVDAVKIISELYTMEVPDAE